MMLSCREVIQKVASDRFSAAGRWERFWIRLHLFLCRHCRSYEGQLRDIGAAAREVWSDPSLEPSSLEQLKEHILENLDGDPIDRP